MMGGTAVRVSGSCCIICPRLQQFVAQSSASLSAVTLAVHYSLPSFRPISLSSSSSSSFEYQSSARHRSSRSICLQYSHPLLSSAPFPSFPLMNSGLVPSPSPSFSSSCGIRLGAFTRFTRSSRRRHATNLLYPSNVRLSPDPRPPGISRSSILWGCSRETRGVMMSKARKRKGRRIECCSSQAGGDQPASSSSSSSSVLPPLSPIAKAKGLRISFCPRCGGETEEKIPFGEHELRFVCTACGAVHYQNPKMVVGCLVEHEQQVLLCKRNIEPSYGLWTLPAGYMEIGESAAEGAARETWEEACADVQVLSLFAHLDIPFIGQSYIIFRAQLKNPHFAPGPESLECALFKLDEIPFDNLAFSSIHVALKLYAEDIKAGHVKVHYGVIDKRPGASPSDLKGFSVRDVLSS